MRQSLTLITDVMLVLTLWMCLPVSAAHAAQSMGCIDLSADSQAHALGDGDEVEFIALSGIAALN